MKFDYVTLDEQIAAQRQLIHNYSNPEALRIANAILASLCELRRLIAGHSLGEHGALGTMPCPICTDAFPHTHGTGWIGVDFDGTLAHSIPRSDPYTLGPPVDKMVLRVREWLSRGMDVKLLTARMCPISRTLCVSRDIIKMEKMLRAWCREHIGRELECVDHKDGGMEVLWDDRAVRVVRDTGIPVTQAPQWIEEELLDGDRICYALNLERTEGGSLPINKILSRITSL